MTIDNVGGDRFAAFITHEFLNLSKKVDYMFVALDEVKAAEAELAAIIDHTVKTLGEVSNRLDSVDAGEEELKALAARLRNLKDVLASHVGTPEAAPQA